MNAKKIALMTLEQMPDNVTFDTITCHLEVLAALQKGLDSLDQGRGKSVEEWKSSWAYGLANNHF